MEVAGATDVAVVGIVAAAGSSRRLGTDKRRLLWRGATVLEHSVALLRAGGVPEVIVVLEPRSPCAALLAGRDGVRQVVNPDPARGMLSSIRVGLDAVAPAVEVAAIHPADHPFVPPAAVARLLAAYAAERPLLLVPRYAGRRGHPLLLARQLFAEARACDDAVGLRQLLRRRAADVRLLDLDLPDADDDIDRPEDLERLRR